MPSKAQAKAAIDNAATDVKNDIDNILPVGVNIVDGGISFNPIRWTITLDAGASGVTADSWLATIQANLTTANRTFTVTRIGRRRSDPRRNNVITIISAQASYRITNF